jgi:hypothetical protein
MSHGARWPPLPVLVLGALAVAADGPRGPRPLPEPIPAGSRRGLVKRTGMALLLLVALSGCGPDPAPAVLAAACSAPAVPSAPWLDTVTPFEGGNDSGRTHLFAGACSAVDAKHPPQIAAVAQGLASPYNIVTAGKAVYLLGGAYGRIGADQQPFVARLDADTLAEQWRQPVPGLGPADWNYPGAIGMHANGDVYAIHGRQLLRLDPATGALRARATLPANQPAADVAYNGFVLLSDGRIAAKSIHRLPGCEQPDFQAFFRCDTAGVAASLLVLLDDQTLQVLQTLELPEHTRFRLTAARLAGEEYLYLPGEEYIHRYRYIQGRLSHDPAWRPSYLGAGQTAGTAVAAFGDWLVVQTNGIPARAPLSIVAISQRDAARQHRIKPFAAATRAGSFMPSMPTVDPDNRRVYAFDGYAGELAALDFDAQRGFSLAWRQPQRSFAFSALVGPAPARVLIATDLTAPLPNFALRHLSLESKRGLMRYARPSAEELVWRAAADGRELGRSTALAAVAGSALTPGAGGSLYVPDVRGGRVLRLVAGHPAEGPR